MADFDSHNQRAIDQLNQRGGRMLSLVDLVDAGTLPLDIAAVLAWTAAHGGSILTAAGPGGVGKTTLLGAYLAFLPSEAEVVTVDSARVLERPVATHHECLLIHEINKASYFGYFWGSEVGKFMSMIGKKRSVAATLHAESRREILRKLTGAPLGTRREHIGRVDLMVVMTVHEELRRVTEVWVAVGSGEHEQVLAYDPRRDAFRTDTDESLQKTLARRFSIKATTVAKELAEYQKLLDSALDGDIRLMDQVRGLARRGLTF